MPNDARPFPFRHLPPPPAGTGPGALRRAAAFMDGPGRVIALLAVTLMFVRIFLD